MSDNISVLNMNARGSGVWGLRIDSGDNVSISDSRIEGYPYLISDGVYLSATHNLKLDNVEIINASYGVFISSYLSYNIRVNNTILRNFGPYGITTNPVDNTKYIRNIMVENSTFYKESSGTAIRFYRVDGGKIFGNEVNFSGSDSSNGIDLVTYTQNIAVSENRVEETYTGIHMSSAYYNTIRNNTLLKLGYSGITMYVSSRNLIEGNVINSTGNYGILIGGGSNSNIIKENYIGNATSYGISAQSSTKLNEIYNNSFYFNHGSTSQYDSDHVQAYDASGTNYWNTSGIPHGYGNYWYDWANNNDTNDQNHDGIVDWPYKLDGGVGAEDSYPLTSATAEIPELSPIWIIGVAIVVGIAILLRRR